MRACVKWSCNKSIYFDIKSGCPKDSIFGPKLFSLVVDELLKHLEEAYVGCRVGLRFACAIAYADDLVLLTSSERQLQLMLDLCVNFGKECDLSFNVKKSLWGFVGVLIGYKYPQFHLDLSDRRKTDWFVYLGVKFKFGLKLCVDIH